MSLYQKALISVLEGLKDGTFIFDTIKLTLYQDLGDVISAYMVLSSAASFHLSMSNNLFELADYYYDKMPQSQTSSEVIRSLKEQSKNNNKEAVVYLMCKDESNRNTLLNIGLEYSSYGGHLDLVEWFIVQGADNMNHGMFGALKRRDITLLNYFMKKGANDFHTAYEIISYLGDLPLLNYLSQQSGQFLANLDYSVIAHALEGGNNDLIKIVRRRDVVLNIRLLCPIIISLVRKLKFVTKLGRNYSNEFYLLKSGFASTGLLKFLFYLYIYENNLGDENSFKMDDFLKEILINTPAYFDINKEENIRIPNTHLKNTIDIIRNIHGADFDFNVNGNNDTKHTSKFLICNMFRSSEAASLIDPTSLQQINIVLDNPDIHVRLAREETLLSALTLTYTINSIDL